MRVLVVLALAVVVGAAGAVGAPASPAAADVCSASMPPALRFAQGDLFLARYEGVRPKGGGRSPDQVFRVERVFANGGERTSSGRLKLEAGRRIRLSRSRCSPAQELTEGARYLVSRGHLLYLDTIHGVAWRIAADGSARLVREYRSNRMDPRLAGPTTLVGAIRLMQPGLDGIGIDGLGSNDASQLDISCAGEATLNPPSVAPAIVATATAPRSMETAWSRMAPAPFGAEYAVAAWMGRGLIVVDPRSGRTAVWSARNGRWSERRPAPFPFATFDSHAAWDGRRLLLLAAREDRLIPLAYHPGRDEWVPLAPAPIGPVVDAVWTGATLVAATLDGAAAAYDPIEDCWLELPPIGGAGAVVGLIWTGDRLLVDTRTPLSSRAIPEARLVELDPGSLTGREGPAAPGPIGHSVRAVVSEGSVVFWSWDGASSSTSLRYDPVSTTWEELDWTCRTAARDPVPVGPLIVSSDGRLALDPATGVCRPVVRPPHRVWGRAAIVATGGALIAWSGTRTEDGPPVRDGLILRFGPKP